MPPKLQLLFEQYLYPAVNGFHYRTAVVSSVVLDAGMHPCTVFRGCRTRSGAAEHVQGLQNSLCVRA